MWAAVDDAAAAAVYEGNYLWINIFSFTFMSFNITMQGTQSIKNVFIDSKWRKTDEDDEFIKKAGVVPNTLLQCFHLALHNIVLKIYLRFNIL